MNANELLQEMLSNSENSNCAQKKKAEENAKAAADYLFNCIGNDVSAATILRFQKYISATNKRYHNFTVQSEYKKCVRKTAFDNNRSGLKFVYRFLDRS